MFLSSARKSEEEGFVKLGAIGVLSLERSREYRSRHPERCVQTQFVERWKPTDDGKANPKHRIVLTGWRGLDIFQLHRQTQ